MNDQGNDDWVESNAREDSIAELNPAGSLVFETGVSVSLGNIFGGTQDLQFEYGTLDGPATGTVQYVLNLDGSTAPSCKMSLRLVQSLETWMETARLLSQTFWCSRLTLAKT